MGWTRGPTIGRGSTAAVFLATSTPTGDFFAVKSSDLSSSAFLLQREEYMISQLCSPYIVKCFGSDTTCHDQDNKPMYNLFLEYVPGGTLSDQIEKQGGSLNENTIRVYAYQVLLGLNYLHMKKGLVHCDIKGQNILIGNDGGIKIADFGCAKWGVDATSSFSGTPAYMAPEVARGEEQSFPADIWALGCTVIEMATGTHPWPETKDHPASTLYRIAFSDDVPDFPGWFSDEAKEFLSRCLTRDSGKRWTATELLQHPFFSSVQENWGEIRGPFATTRRSPTSVTDQDFWDAFEQGSMDSSRNPTEEIASSSDSPAGRIRALIGDASPSRLDFTEEEDWLTVRANETEECIQVEDMDLDFEDFVVAESIMVEEGIETSTLMEDSLLDCFNGNNSSSSTFLAAHTESAKEFLYLESSILKLMLMEFFLHQDQLLLQLSNIFSFFLSLFFGCSVLLFLLFVFLPFS